MKSKSGKANPDSVGDAKLASATGELGAQHPIAHYDHGPHHGTTTHQRHQPVDLSKVKC